MRLWNLFVEDESSVAAPGTANSILLQRSWKFIQFFLQLLGGELHLLHHFFVLHDLCHQRPEGAERYQEDDSGSYPEGDG